MKVICSDRLSGAAREFETLWNRVSYDDVAVFIELCPFSCDEEYEVVCGDRLVLRSLAEAGTRCVLLV